MAATVYAPLTGMSDEDFDALFGAFRNASMLASAFSAGPDADTHCLKQGVMALLNEAEKRGLVTLTYPEKVTE